MNYHEDVILGLDVGIGSLGWALVRIFDNGEVCLVTHEDKQGNLVEGLGSRTFDMPENPKSKELLNQRRRAARQQRRVIRRRAMRMRQVRSLLEEYGFSGVRNHKKLHQSSGSQPTPWQLRAEGLRRVLSDDEFAVVLLHMAKHRGFQSNSKRDKSGDDKETGRMLKAADALAKRLEEEPEAPTIGALLARESRQRNRSGIDGKAVYERTMRRRLLREEAALLFEKQRVMGNAKASQALHDRYVKIAFEQRPLKSTADLVGNCAFIEGAKRAPRFAPTAERFRLAAKLVTVRLESAALYEGKLEQRALTREEVAAVLNLLGTQKQKSITYALIRKTLKLPESWRFSGLAYGGKDKKGKILNPETADVVNRTGACAEGTACFLGALGEASFARLMRSRAENGLRCLDEVAKVFSDNDDLRTIEEALRRLPLQGDEAERLLDAVQGKEFARFRGVMHLSLRAMEEILPHLVDSLSYNQGCELAGFDHSKALAVNMDDVRNPLVRRIIREVKRQTDAVVREFGIIPGRIHVELARDVGKSVDERNSIDKGIKDRTGEKIKHKKEFAELLGLEPEQISADELLRYELWLQQGGKCAYYLLWGEEGKSCYAGEHKEGAIPITALRDAEHATQIDHILPRSRTQDNSFHNRCLCIPAANQAKGGRTPYEWVGARSPQKWHEFEEWVSSQFKGGFKKRNFLMKDLSEEKENCFCSRNLNDTRYASRLVMHAMQEKYDKEWQDTFGLPTHHADGSAIRRVFARPGQVTAYLRRLWGLESLKKDDSGKRLGDRHHALDAFVIACCTESALQKVTRIYQRVEEGRPTDKLPQLMPDCREKIMRSMGRVFVSRAERGSGKGALHEETLRAIRMEQDEKGKLVEVLYERVPVDKLVLKDLERIKDAERCPGLVTALADWIQSGKPREAEKLPCLVHTDKSGGQRRDLIRRVRLRRGAFSSGIRLRRGEGTAQADNVNIVRTEVYTRDNKFYLVPVYTWQVAQGIRPDRVIKGKTLEADWPLLDETFAFCFSIFPKTYVLTEDSQGQVREGYFISTDRSTGRITLALAHDRKEEDRIGVQRLKRFEKYRVDRLGRLSRVNREKRP